MTSMPASRSARAMILAPLSWPSRPGFAITTRIFLATLGQSSWPVYDRRVDERDALKLHVVGCSPAWPNPGGARQLSDFGERFGWSEVFERVFALRASEGGKPFRAGGFEILPLQLPHYT